MARAALAALPESRVLAATAPEDTAPVGPVPQGTFVNQMVALETTLAPIDLLDRLLEIERAAGRERTVRWVSNTTPCARQTASSALAIAAEPVRATGHVLT